MRMDSLADVDRIRAHLDRERDLADQVAGARTDDAAADDAMRRGIEEEFGETLVAAIGDRAARSRPGEKTLLDLHALGLRLVFGKAHPGDLGVGIRDRWDHARIEEGFLARGRFGGHMTLLHRLVRWHRLPADV